MPNMTLKELIEKIQRIPRYYGIDPEKEVITDAFVVTSGNKTYPPGSVVFQCEERNTTLSTEEDVHYLSIHPDKISTLQ